MVWVIVIVEDSTVTVRCRTAIIKSAVPLLYFVSKCNVGFSLMFSIYIYILSYKYKIISYFLTNGQVPTHVVENSYLKTKSLQVLYNETNYSFCVLYNTFLKCTS
jgi:hypothetical protein